MTLSTRFVVLACAVLLVLSATVTFVIERHRSPRPDSVQVARPTSEPAATPTPVPAKRITCDSLLAARSATLGESFDVPPDDVYRGPPAKVDFSGRREALMFQTRITEAMARGVNFGGRFVVASWECDTNCQEHAIVDAKTGAIVSFGLRTEAGLEYSVRSRLLVTNPKKNVSRSGLASVSPLARALKYSRIPREYYEVVARRSTSYLNRLCVESAFVDESP